MIFHKDRIVAIRFRRPRVSRDTRVRDLIFGECHQLNGDLPVGIVGVRSVDFFDAVEIGLTHPEFPELDDGERVPVYELDQARVAFPFLFSSDTNPILYRRFRL